MSNPTDLMSCPFCGNKPTMVEWTASAPEIRCDPCGIVMDGLREEVTGAWNRRAQPEGEAPQAEPEPNPSLEDCPEDDQHWAKVDPAVAFHLIERHAEDWADAGRMMLQWHNAISRAAQLDGGQEGSGSNG